MPSHVANISCDDARRQLLEECVMMDIVDREFFFQQQAFDELTSTAPEIARKAPGKYNHPFAVHVRQCTDCQAYFKTNEFKSTKKAEVRLQVQAEIDWWNSYTQ